MNRETISRVAILLSLSLSLLSLRVTVTTSSSLSLIIIERFFAVFAISALLIWAALTIINSVVIPAARDSASKKLVDVPRSQAEANLGNDTSLTGASEKAYENAASRQHNIDPNPTLQEDIFGISNMFEDEEGPEIRELKPFNPQEIEIDKDREI